MNVLHTKNSCKMMGFSLLEMSIALSILAFLSYTLTLGVKTTRDHDKYAENAIYLENVRVGLLTFAQSNGYLPCPDTDGNGRENRPGGVCDKKNGRLPFQMIGASSVDVWGESLYYTINERADVDGVQDIADVNGVASATYFNNTTAPLFNLKTMPIEQLHGDGNLTVCGENLALTATCSAATPDINKIEITAIAVVVSFGKNASETWNQIDNGVAAGLATAEAENADSKDFWKARGSNVVGQEFDDQLVWLTGYDVKYALLISGRGLQ
jgi:prepilin-type N-terminal cleavage/methylation domain-containing protein